MPRKRPTNEDKLQISLLSACGVIGAVCVLAAILYFTVSGGCGTATDPNDELLRHLHDQEISVRRTAARQISTLRPVPEKYVEPLIAALNDNDPQVRHTAAEALGEAGIGARPHVQQINELAATHFDPQVRFALQQAIYKINNAQ